MSQAPLRGVDRDLLVAVGRQGEATVADLTGALHVTATAVRQRVERLIGDGFIDRDKIPAGRGRPTYRYRLTIAGQKAVGAKTADLATALWHEVKAIEDPAIREQVLRGVARRMGSMVAAELNAVCPTGAVVQLSAVMSSRDVAMAPAAGPGGLPVLDIGTCPYPTLTAGADGQDVDRTMCQLEERMFSEALGRPVQLSSCRLDGDHHCQFTAVDAVKTASSSDQNPA